MSDYQEKKATTPSDDIPAPQMSAGSAQNVAAPEGKPQPKGFGPKLLRELKTPGSAIQIIIAAALAIGIGLAVAATVDDIPEAAPTILQIPGDLWLRALKAVVLPLIVTAMILAVQRLKEMAGSGPKLAWLTIGWYIATTLVAIIQSCIMVSQVWRRLMTEMDAEEQEGLFDSEDDKEEYESREDTKIHDVVVMIFESFIPKNVVTALAEDELLAIIITSIVVGYLISPNGTIIKIVREVEKIITTIIMFLIKIAPIGVFFLILPNLFKLDMEAMGQNLGVLIGGSICDMFIHLFIVLPIMFFAATRTNPYTYWFKNSRAWITAWGTASSAATLSVTMDCAKDRGIPFMVRKFALPLGTLINMDGTAIYFPVIVVFMATTQGIELSAADYVIIALLATLASIGTTPIPSSSLVLTVMIAGAVDVPVSGSYALAVAFDWFIDRFRTAVNVSGDLFAVGAVTKLGKFADPDDYVEDEDVGQIRDDESAHRV